MTKRYNSRRLLVLVLGLMTATPPALAAAGKPTQPVDRCVVRRSVYTGNALDTLVFQNVESLSPGRTIPLRGIYFTPIRIPTPFHGSAMMSSDGTIRIGILVHYSGIIPFNPNIPTQDITFSGATDVNFAGALNFSGGDLLTDGSITFVSEPCDVNPIP